MTEKEQHRIDAAHEVFAFGHEPELAREKEREDMVGSLEQVSATEALARIDVAIAENFELRSDLPSIFRNADSMDHRLADLLNGRVVCDWEYRHAARSARSL
jgi:hypothetical protein